MTRIEELKQNIERVTVSIKGYIADSKNFGFEPTSLKGMQEKKQNWENELNELAKTFKLTSND